MRSESIKDVLETATESTEVRSASAEAIIWLQEYRPPQVAAQGGAMTATGGWSDDRLPDASSLRLLDLADTSTPRRYRTLILPGPKIRVHGCWRCRDIAQIATRMRSLPNNPLLVRSLRFRMSRLIRSAIRRISLFLLRHPLRLQFT